MSLWKKSDGQYDLVAVGWGARSSSCSTEVKACQAVQHRIQISSKNFQGGYHTQWAKSHLRMYYGRTENVFTVPRYLYYVLSIEYVLSRYFSTVRRTFLKWPLAYQMIFEAEYSQGILVYLGKTFQIIPLEYVFRVRHWNVNWNTYGILRNTQFLSVICLHMRVDEVFSCYSHARLPLSLNLDLLIWTRESCNNQ